MSITSGFPVGSFMPKPTAMFCRDSVGGRHSQVLAEITMSPRPLLCTTAPLRLEVREAIITGALTLKLQRGVR